MRKYEKIIVVFFFSFSRKVIQCREYLHCELVTFLIPVFSGKGSGMPPKLCMFVPLPHSVLLNHNLPKSSFQLHFEIFSTTFSSSFLYLSFISILAQDYFCHILEKEQKNACFFWLSKFPKHCSQSSDEEEQIIAAAAKSNEHDCKNKQEVYCAKKCFSIPICPSHTLRIHYKEKQG